MNKLLIPPGDINEVKEILKAIDTDEKGTKGIWSVCELTNKWSKFSVYTTEKYKLKYNWIFWCKWYLIEYKKMKCEEILK